MTSIPPPDTHLIYLSLLPRTPPPISQFLSTHPSPSQCGYCGQKLSKVQRRAFAKDSSMSPQQGRSISTSQFLFNLPPHIYDTILNKNYRRCGDYYYAPKNDLTCCPQYAIRLDVGKFQRREKKHRAVWNKMGRYLRDGEDATDSNMHEVRDLERLEAYKRDLHAIFDALGGIMKNAMIQFVASPDGAALSKLPELQDQIGAILRESLQLAKRKGVSVASNALIKLFGMAKKHKIDLGGKLPDLTEAFAKCLREDITSSTSPKVLSVEGTKNGWLNFQLETMPEEPKTDAQSTTKAQSGATPHYTPQQIRTFIDNGLDVKLSPAKFHEEEYELYKKYQMSVHKDLEEDVSVRGYTDFLVESSLVHVSDKRLPFGGYGTYHLQYRIKKTNQLLGVSVVDILPTGWSSVYFFYDPDFSFLSPGVFSVLYEIDMIREMSKKHPEFKYLYLGFYIHTCPKMRYKGEYAPSELLCPETHTWVPLETAAKVLDKAKYGRFQPDPEVPRFDAGIDTVGDLQLVANRTLIPAAFILEQQEFMEMEEGQKLKEDMLVFKRTMGKESAEEVAYYVNFFG